MVLFDRRPCEAAVVLLWFCGKLCPFFVTFSYIFSYATFLEKEPVRSSTAVIGHFCALPGDGFLTAELLKDSGAISRNFFYILLIRDFIRKSFRKIQNFSNYYLSRMAFLRGVYRGNSIATIAHK